MDGSSTARGGSVSKKTTDAANACHSFCEREGGTGVNGARLSAGLAQQAGVEQVMESQPVRQQPDFAAGAFAFA